MISRKNSYKNYFYQSDGHQGIIQIDWFLP